ncbi:MAG: peptidase C1 [Candidatus Neomarinimicrobiota bacterium]
MKKFITLLCICGLVFAESDLIFKEKYVDPVHAAIRDIRHEKIANANAKTEAILSDSYQRDNRSMYASIEGIDFPLNNDDFTSYFHFPPKHQGLTSSCWAHAGISFIESETARNFDKKIKLSLMFIVYYDYLDKAEYFIKTRGAASLRGGSQVSSVFNVAEKYGLMPEKNYSGNPTEMGDDLGPMHDELEAYLDFIKANDFWDESTNLKTVRAILDKHLGKIPDVFTYQSKKYTPDSFYKKVLKFKPKKYTPLQSTLSFTFGEKHEFPFPDHWSKGKDFLNLPLENFYKSIVNTIKAGITVPIAGDISEAGYNRYTGIAFIPKADIALEDIDQDSREYRIYNGTTGDDHALLIVAYTEINGVDWFLIKDSARMAWQSTHPGYYYYRGDYIKLKMLNAIVPTQLIEK